MRRVLAFALIFALGNASAATAQGLLDSARRIARDLDGARASTNTATSTWRRRDAGRLALQGQPGPASRGPSRRAKVLILVAIGVGVAGAAYAIDRGVEDPTLSSRAER